ncbi:LOW QUALITY PROTEIN: cytokine receptor common subunit beta-like [Alligator sinensis]|uniref:LOW QUALITY PROTEIN: cytokine receptor common subunit beta-like n=1 Tax=Alligator sinensis TaxID=38654 RepID=A0A3Q0GWW9_ALLSI|nr:LOW QUALITY PROTEIN: cytokine receptor common subunit beta-like [Alligator sinensis]
MIELCGQADMKMEFCSIILGLVLALWVGDARESVPMQSLHCYNDYAVQTTCVWQECSEARHFLNMTLFKMHDNTMNGMEIPCESRRVEEHTDCQGSHVRWVCPRNISFRTDIYIFKPDRELQAELNVTLFQTEEASPLPFSGDDGQPKNLRCHFNGVDRLLCSWEVRQEVTSSVLFTLFYKVTQTSEEKECLQVYEEKVSDIPYVQQHCEIYVTNCNHTSQYHVTVRPKKEEKHIDASKHIKVLAPTNLTVTTKEDQEYELRWVKHKLQYGFIKQSYQVLYWKADQSSEAAKSINISNDEPPFIFPSQMLESSTCYRAKMRARVNASSDYNGPWSEWSEECAWQTGHVVSPLILPFMVSVVTIILIATGWCSCKYLFNKKKKWEEKIPNPSKSQLVQGFFQKGPLGNLMPSKLVVFDNQSHLEKVEQINNIQVLHSMVKVILARSSGTEAPNMDLRNWYHTSEVPGSASFSAAPCAWHSSQRTSHSIAPAPFACVGSPTADTPSWEDKKHHQPN